MQWQLISQKYAHTRYVDSENIFFSIGLGWKIWFSDLLKMRRNSSSWNRKPKNSTFMRYYPTNSQMLSHRIIQTALVKLLINPKIFWQILNYQNYTFLIPYFDHRTKINTLKAIIAVIVIIGVHVCAVDG